MIPYRYQSHKNLFYIHLDPLSFIDLGNQTGEGKKPTWGTSQEVYKQVKNKPTKVEANKVLQKPRTRICPWAMAKNKVK